MRFNKTDIIKYHGNVEEYRNLYEGNHGELFERAKNLIENGEITDRIEHGRHVAKNIKTPYIIANISKVIIDIPALFISRSIGKLMTNYPINKEEAEEDFHTNTEHLEISDIEINEEDGAESHIHADGTVFDLQQDTLDQISDNSKLEQQHKSNIKQWQIDGGLVLVPEIKNGQAKLSFKERNVYFELDDGQTYQLRFYIEFEETEYVHVHEEKEFPDRLEVKHMVYEIGNREEIEVDDPEIFKKITGLDYENKERIYEGRKRRFIEYLAYEPTFMNKYGVSALKNQAGKQDEVNWTITRTAQIFQRNGKPQISVTPEIMNRLVEISNERSGYSGNPLPLTTANDFETLEEQLANAGPQRQGQVNVKSNSGPLKIDYRDLEFTEMNERGESIKTHQIDIDKIGNMPYVKDIIRMMLMETQTSEKAVDFFNDNHATAQSGVSKFYDLFLSVMKAEQMRDEYINFIQRGVENCLWLIKKENNENIIVEKPIIQQDEMLPITTKEVTEQNNASYSAGTQSLEQTIRNNNLDKSEEWIMNELELIEASNVSTDSMTFLRGNMTAQNFNDNIPLGVEMPENETDIEDNE